MNKEQRDRARRVAEDVGGPSHEELRAPLQKSLQQIVDEQRKVQRSAVQTMQEELNHGRSGRS
jgi:hypothetical protein